MKITEKHLKELRDCELYQSILPRYQKNIEWMQKYNEYYKINKDIKYKDVIKILTFVFEDEPEKEKQISKDLEKEFKCHVDVISKGSSNKKFLKGTR